MDTLLPQLSSSGKESAELGSNEFEHICTLCRSRVDGTEDGFGAWANASLGRVEASLGPVGVHLDVNVNTGVGLRGGNLDVHVLGFGGKCGVDGITIDTPFGGFKIPFY